MCQSKVCKMLYTCYPRCLELIKGISKKEFLSGMSLIIWKYCMESRVLSRAYARDWGKAIGKVWKMIMDIISKLILEHLIKLLELRPRNNCQRRLKTMISKRNAISKKNAISKSRRNNLINSPSATLPQYATYKSNPQSTRHNYKRPEIYYLLYLALTLTATKLLVCC